MQTGDHYREMQAVDTLEHANMRFMNLVKCPDQGESYVSGFGDGVWAGQAHLLTRVVVLQKGALSPTRLVVHVSSLGHPGIGRAQLESIPGFEFTTKESG